MKVAEWDQQLADAGQATRAWIATVVGDLATVSLTAPSVPPPDKTTEVNAYLMALAPAPPARNQSVPPLQFVARYLVTVRGEDPAREHRVLGRLVLAALAERSEEVDLSTPPLELWRALGLAPRPSFALSVPVRWQPVLTPAPPVREIAIKDQPIAVLLGRVLGEGDIPLAGALVINRTIDATTLTDHEGRFRFATTPGGDTTQLLSISARGLTRSFSVKPPAGRDEPAVFRFATRSPIASAIKED